MVSVNFLSHPPEDIICLNEYEILHGPVFQYEIYFLLKCAQFNSMQKAEASIYANLIGQIQAMIILCKFLLVLLEN